MKTASLAAAALLTLSAWPAFAQTTPQAAAPAKAAPAKAAPAEKTHRALGEVVSVNADAKTFVLRETLKDKSTKEVTFQTSPKARITAGAKEADFARLAPGETVKVQYSTGADGTNVASNVQIMQKAAAKPVTQ